MVCVCFSDFGSALNSPYDNWNIQILDVQSNIFSLKNSSSIQNCCFHPKWTLDNLQIKRSMISIKEKGLKKVIFIFFQLRKTEIL